MLQLRLDPSRAAMPHAFFPLHRAEIGSELQQGERRFDQLVEPRSLSIEARRCLVPAAQEQSFVYRLRSGWCARLRFLKDGRSQVMAILLPGDFVCVRSMVLEQQPDEIATITACQFDMVDQAALRRAAMKDPALTLRLWWQSIEDERRLHNWLIAISRGRAEERLALLLLDIRGRLALAGLVGDDATSIPWPLTQQELGEILGLTAVHVNRTLKELRAKGLVEISSRTARIDPEGLYRIAHPLMDVFERRRPEFGAPRLAANA